MVSPVKAPPKGKSKRVSMQTIAQKAGVSTTTVSLALRGHASISEETKERIIAIQKEMGYDFNRHRVRRPQLYRPKLEQVIYRSVLVDIYEENYAPFLAGVATECRSRALKLELDNVLEQDSSGLRHSHADGGSGEPKRGIILSGRVTDRDIQELESFGLPYVVLGNYILSKPCHLIGVDLNEISRRAMQDLCDEGMKQVVFFVENECRSFEKEFLRHLRVVLKELGVANQVVEAGNDFQNMERAVEAIKTGLQPGGCVVSLERHSAEAIVQSFRSTHTPVPDVVAFVTSRPRLPNPGYRAFDVGCEACGRLAVARLMELQAYPDLPLNRCYVQSPGWIN